MTVMKLFSAIIFSTLLLVDHDLQAQEVFLPGSRVQALAGSSSVLSDCWSVFGNQAGLAVINRIEIGGSFENRFLVNELSTRAGLLVVPIQSSVFAVSFYQFGKIPFRQDKLGIAYARHLSEKFNFGLQFNYYWLFFSEENRSLGSAGVELGFQYLVTSQLMLGIHVVNPYKTAIKTSSGNFPYPSLINFGVLYHLSESFSMMSELENNLTNHLKVRTGMEYNIRNRIYLRTGVSGKPYQLSAGFGFHLKKLTMDLSTTYHQYLGSTPSISFQLQL
ncbi:MAG: hypothetical protein Q8S54_08025 [Bacteroidota bacterium]|nr:hypothetical protein [Bacteroidota bacterium]